MEENIAKLRRELALAMASSMIIDVLRRLKQMPVQTLEALSNAESQEIADNAGLSTGQSQELEAGLKKLDFYVCGVLMHRILDEN